MRFLRNLTYEAPGSLERNYLPPSETSTWNEILCRYFRSTKAELRRSERVPLDFSDYLELVAHTEATSIWLDFINGRSARAKSKRGVCLVNNLSPLVGDDSVANVFRGERELNHECLY